MLKDAQIFIKGCDDVELGIKRKSRLEYRVSYDDERELEGIFFIVGGFGSNADIRMLDFTRKKFATQLPIMVVNVFYHCFACRKSNEEAYSAEFFITRQDVEGLKKLLAKLNLSLNASFNYNEHYASLEDLVRTQKEAGKFEADKKLRGLSYTIIPKNNDYQNYLIMPAIDHILVLKDIQKRFQKVKTRIWPRPGAESVSAEARGASPESGDGINSSGENSGGNASPEARGSQRGSQPAGIGALPKIYGGGCYGGQIAHIIAKIAPQHAQGVIDIACAPLPKYEMFMGREVGNSEFSNQTPHLFIDCYVQTLWTKETFTPAHFQIRALLNAAHLKIQSEAGGGGTIFVSYHSAQDEFDTAKDKQTLYEAYRELGFDATLHLFKDEGDIDGRVVRDLTHGGISNDRVFKKELPKMLAKLRDRDFTAKEGQIAYPCGDKIFTFKDRGDRFTLEITDPTSGGGGVKPASNLIRAKNPLKR